MITEVTGFLQQTDRIVWGPWLIFLLLGCGCYLMISLFFLPLRNLLAALGLVFHPKSRKGTDGEGVSSFSALTTELAATIGTGNIVGVATAMVLGGPGALFWMLLSGIIGLSTKLVESTLCVRYRVRDHKGKPVGGPMYVLQNAFPYRRMGRILAVLFAIFAVLASFGMGNMTQGNSIAEALAVTFGVDRTVTGLVIGIFTILVILGGIDKIARVTEYLVPCMAVFYLFGTGMVIFTHFQEFCRFYAVLSARKLWQEGALDSYVPAGRPCAMVSPEEYFPTKRDSEQPESVRLVQIHRMRCGKAISA